MSDLKSSYRKHLTAFIALNLVIFISMVFFGVKVTSLSASFDALTKTVLYILVGPIITVVVSGWLSAEFKTSLVFWRFTNPLPGSRAFTQPMINDPRIDLEGLRTRVGEFPKDPQEQNQVWYKLMKSESDDPAILQAHRDWLFTRDLTGYSFIFLIALSLIGYIAVPNILMIVVYAMLLFTQYLLIMLSARTYGVRFVRNVLAKVSSHQSTSGRL